MTKQDLINRLATKGEIEIHPHPLIPNIKRLLVLDRGIETFPTQKQIVLKWDVYYLDEHGNRINNSIALQKYERNLTATDEIKINSEMKVLNVGDEGYENADGQFTHFNNLILSGQNYWGLILETTLFRASEIGGSKFD
jgi:hypothetical protein